MADPPSYTGTRDDSGTEPGGRPAGRRPRRAVLAWVIVAALVLLMLILHLTGAVGPGTMG